MNTIERLITEQVLTWNKQKELTNKNKEKPFIWPVITISREYGAGGRSLARELGRRIGFKIWDKELLSAIAEEAGADEQFMGSLDERRRKLIDDFLYGSFMGSKHSNTHYFRSLLRVVHTIGAHGSSILVGRGGNYIIKSPDSLHIRIVRPFIDRVAYVAELEGISRQNAEKVIKARDAEREDFIQHYFKRDVNNPGDFDMVINSGVFDTVQLADLVLSGYEKKSGLAVPIINS